MSGRSTENGSFYERPTFLTLHENLRHHVDVRPEKLALLSGDRTFTFEQLYHTSCRIAGRLQRHGITPRDHVGIYLRNHWSYVPIYYALSMLGAVAVPINYMLRGTQAAELLEWCDCKYLFTELQQHRDLLTAGGRPATALPVCFVDEVSDTNADHIERWIEAGNPVNESQVRVDIHDPMMILFSSGTTGMPKGITLSHLNRVLYFFELGMEYGIRYDEVNLCTTPLYHNAAIFFAFNNLYFGSTTVVHRKFDVLTVFHDIESYGVTNAFFVPTQLHQLIHSPQRQRFDLSTLRIIVSGAAPLSTTTKERILECFPEVDLHELYGLTETGLITNLRPADQFRKVRCAGQAFMNMQFRIVGSDGNEVTSGEIGEIVARGPTLFDGYYGDEQATREAWREGWFHTGDLGKVDDEGFLYIVDRLKDMILSGGVNIYPKDIEDVIYTLPQVQDVAVIGIPDEKWGEAVHAIVAPRDADALTAEQVVACCEQKLSAYQVPRSLEFRKSLPRNPSGKLLKRVLRAEFWEDNEQQV